jgi:aspartyl-tRNA(Asn)/glutamyl-tRNA(Gln) amidotransferase subunit B
MTPARASTTASSDSDRNTYVDLNRCGTPLIEIVSEPDMRSADEALRISHRTEQALQFVEVSTLRHGEGPPALRRQRLGACRKGEAKFGTRAEVKNLNSFRFLKQAIDYEIARQVGMDRGRRPRSCRKRACTTRRFRRDREHAQQGRRARLPLLPEPDLVPLRDRAKSGGARLRRPCRNCRR